MVGLHQTLNLFIDLILTVGGMDLYVRQFGLQTHDQFYTDPSILTAFMNYTTQVVSRYVNSPSVFSYELANDPRYVMAYLAGPLSLITLFRCNSTLPASATCTTETITTWHATVASHIRSIDPNHLISSGYVTMSVTTVGTL